MNELQAIAIAALDTIKNDEGAELARLHKALHRAKFGDSDKGEVEEANSALGEAEARHRRICDAIDWVKAIPQLDHMTTHKAAELRSRGYRDVGVVLQDELGSTAVVANGAVRWINNAEELFAFMHPSENTVLVDGTTTTNDQIIGMPYKSSLVTAVKNAILGNSHPAPDWHLAFNCADEIDIVANQIATKFAELANQQTVAVPVQEPVNCRDAKPQCDLCAKGLYEQCRYTTKQPAQQTATPCGQVTTTQTGKHTCTTMRVGDEKICPDCSPKRNFLEWLGEQQPTALPTDQPVSDTCPDCGRLKALSADDCAKGHCPKWYAILDLDAAIDCMNVIKKEGKVQPC